VDRANQQLAFLYLKDGRYDNAMDIFEKFINLGDDERELRAFGLAGKCVALSSQGKYRESGEILNEFLQIGDKLNSPQMDRYLQEAIIRNRSQLMEKE
jgi:tetratricopeptide (TPR) repeat protein